MSASSKQVKRQPPKETSSVIARLEIRASLRLQESASLTGSSRVIAG